MISASKGHRGLDLYHYIVEINFTEPSVGKSRQLIHDEASYIFRGSHGLCCG